MAFSKSIRGEGQIKQAVYKKAKKIKKYFFICFLLSKNQTFKLYCLRIVFKYIFSTYRCMVKRDGCIVEKHKEERD
jgi:hypothetical protein